MQYLNYIHVRDIWEIFQAKHDICILYQSVIVAINNIFKLYRYSLYITIFSHAYHWFGCLSKEKQNAMQDENHMYSKLNLTNKCHKKCTKSKTKIIDLKKKKNNYKLTIKIKNKCHHNGTQNTRFNTEKPNVYRLYHLITSFWINCQSIKSPK